MRVLSETVSAGERMIIPLGVALGGMGLRMGKSEDVGVGVGKVLEVLGAGNWGQGLKAPNCSRQERPIHRRLVLGHVHILLFLYIRLQVMLNY